MASEFCGGTTSAVYECVRASAGPLVPVQGTLDYPQYILSAPLTPSTPPTLFIGEAFTASPGWTKKLVLSGAPSFRIRVDASMVVYAGGVLDLYVSAGIGLTDTVVETWGNSSQLPTGTLRFNYGVKNNNAGTTFTSV